jgi:hypothetical protein
VIHSVIRDESKPLVQSGNVKSAHTLKSSLEPSMSGVLSRTGNPINPMILTQHNSPRIQCEKP